jgi:hypothetical protein
VLETSLYCRPDIVCFVWFALKMPDNRVVVFGNGKEDKPLGPYEVLYLDADQQLIVTSQGQVVQIPPERALTAKPENNPFGYTEQLCALLSTPRHIRKPANYVDPDSSPQLRALLSR